MPKDDEGSNQRFARRFTHGASPRKAPEKTPTAGKPPVTIHQQSRNRPIRRTELAADKELPKEVTHLAVEPEGYEKHGGAPRPAPAKVGPSIKPPGGNQPKDKK